MAGAETGILGTPEFNPYGAGARIYGSGRMNPTMGTVDKTGYRNRDLARRARLNALRARTKAQTQGNYASPDFMRYI